jgi:hypothetical protein
MDYQEAIRAVNEYYDLCKLYGLKFEWSLEGLINNPGNIRLALIRRKIKKIREVYPLQKKGEKVVRRKQKINKPISEKKKERKPPKREIRHNSKIETI